MDDIYAKLVEIVGDVNVSKDDKVLDEYFKRYSENFLIKTPIKPKFIIKVKNKEEIQQILKLANGLDFSVVPISSANGAEAPHADNGII
ncbi:MAG: FAD-binding oxidoreductase, partial [Candidatus Helarchaeota archaeon]|nr:FAD-binding oxidoreductase [Candidatus Helarchaeota archaeon]